MELLMNEWLPFQFYMEVMRMYSELLTPREIIFAIYHAHFMNQTQSAQLAGYSLERAKQTGYRLSHKLSVILIVRWIYIYDRYRDLKPKRWSYRRWYRHWRNQLEKEFRQYHIKFNEAELDVNLLRPLPIATPTLIHKYLQVKTYQSHGQTITVMPDKDTEAELHSFGFH